MSKHFTKNLAVFVAAMMVLLFGATAYAFQDVQESPARQSIMALKEAGIVNGVDESRFDPGGKVTLAQGIHLIVKGLDLNIDPLRFVKEPKASDYLLNVPDDAWYAKSFVIAHLNGLPLAKDADPGQTMTREQFAHFLMKALLTKGDYAFIEIFILIHDADEINPDYMDSIQKLLITKIVELDDMRNFAPKAELTRAEAAVWLHKAIQFWKKPGNSQNETPAPPKPDDPAARDEVTMNIEKVTDEVNKVTLSWGEKPNSGYSLKVRSIEFKDNNEAVIYYERLYPEKDKMYLTVITEPKAATFLPAGYKPVLKPYGEATVSHPN